MNYAKLLLFGEYTVLLGGNCLALPFSRFGGELTLEDPPEGTEQVARWSNRQLLEFYQHIIKVSASGISSVTFDLEQLATDLSRGLWFNSDIPGQSGLGSSGALVAAIVSRYGIDVLSENPRNLARLFSALENNFHGHSSGMDPLVSFLNCPVLKTGDGITMPDLNVPFSDDIKLFMIKIQRDVNTKTLIEEFKREMSDAGFRKGYQSELVAITNTIIHDLCTSTDSAWFGRLKELSRLHNRYYTSLIPHSIQPLMNSELFHLKLLGSGGGFMLGFTRNLKESLKLLTDKNIPAIRIKTSSLVLS